MLGLEDIKKVSFRRSALGGYKPEDVDCFIDKVQISFEKLIYEKRNLALKIKDLEESLERYTSEENAIKDIILSLKEVTQCSLQRANEKASEVISQANRTSDRIISSAKNEVLEQEKICNDLKKESINLKNKLESVYKEHIKIISEIPCSENGAVEEQENSEPLQEAITGGCDINEPQNLDKKDKLKNLEFGSNYQIGAEKPKSQGLYGGIFKKHS